ncbi:hypothetical protein U1Q18_028082 [Sarracenia purpurea var. burkii]
MMMSFAKVQGFSGMAPVAAKPLLVSTKTPIGSTFFVPPRSISRLCLEREDFSYSFLCFDYSVKPFDTINMRAMEIIGNADYKERLVDMNPLSVVISSLATISPCNQGWMDVILSRWSTTTHIL